MLSVRQSLVLVALFFSAFAHAQSPLKIGLVVPQTGALKGAGKDVASATVAWASEHNRNGGLRGRKIDLRVYDDESSADGAKRAATKAIADGVELFVNCFGTVACIQIAKEAQAANLALLGPIAGAEVLREAPFSNVFSTRPSASQEMAAIFKYVTTVGQTETTVVYQDDGFGKGYRDVLAKATESTKGFRIKNQFAIDINTRNFDDVAAKVTASGESFSVVLLCNTPNSIAMISALSKRGYRGINFNLAAQANATFITAVSQEVRANKIIASFVTTAPPPTSRAAVATGYRTALASWAKDSEPGYVGMEAYVNATVLERLTDGFAPARIDATLRRHPRDGQIGGIPMSYQPETRTMRGWLDIAVVSQTGQIRHQ
jgi:branched-chain amino acid transport system substrate-binding protein